MKKFVLLASFFVASIVTASAPVVVPASAPVKTWKQSAFEKYSAASAYASDKAAVAKAFAASKTPVCVTNALTALDAQITARPYCAIAIAAVVAYAAAKLTSDLAQEEDEEDYA